MKIVKISELEGASRYGTCNKCGASSKNDKNMIRISPENGSSICLCKECALELLKDLKQLYKPDEISRVSEEEKVYINYGRIEFKKQLFCPTRNRAGFPKPEGGLWASNVNAEYGWKDWCRDENFRECNIENSFKFKLSDSARVLEINSVKDLEDLPLVSGTKLEGNPYFCIPLDFEKICKNYDAIELTISNDWRLYYSLYGWDCDSILIMNPDIIIPLNGGEDS